LKPARGAFRFPSGARELIGDSAKNLRRPLEAPFPNAAFLLGDGLWFLPFQQTSPFLVFLPLHSPLELFFAGLFFRMKSCRARKRSILAAPSFQPPLVVSNFSPGVLPLVFDQQNTKRPMATLSVPPPACLQLPAARCRLGLLSSPWVPLRAVPSLPAMDPFGKRSILLLLKTHFIRSRVGNERLARRASHCFPAAPVS